MGDWKSFIGVIVLFCIILGTPLHSQEGNDPLKHPGSRYARQNIHLDIIAHWKGAVQAQFIGISAAEVQQMVLAELFALGQASQIDLKVNGFPNAMFDQPALAPESRMIFFQYDASSEISFENGIGDNDSIGINHFRKAHESVLSILEQGLVKQTSGCLARWKATEENEIEAIIIAVSSSISDREKQICFWNLMPTAFGISNVVSLYNATMARENKTNSKEVVFSDRSEIALQLSAAATCREELDDLTIGCPFRLINGILAYHGEIARSGEK